VMNMPHALVRHDGGGKHIENVTARLIVRSRSIYAAISS
jgi:hypothetical protein